MKKIILMMMIFGVSYCSSASEAAELYGRKFQEEIQAQNTAFVLRGLGAKSYFFVKVFVAGFYTEENLKGLNPLEDVSKRLEVAYFYKIPGAKLAVETSRRIRLNTSQNEFDQIKDRVDLMNAYFVDLSPGDRYALTYIPNRGTYFTYNEKLLGRIEGSDFAKALFAVWIGKEPISESLKESLLGKETTSVVQESNDQSSFSNKNMVLLGTALKKILTFRVVTVDLYVAGQYKSEDVLSDIPKRLEVNYHVNIPKKELYRATIKGIKQNFSREQLAALMPQINQINSYYPDIKSGDQIVVTYVPGDGSQVQINGQVKGVVPTAEFAKAFFSIWVGENPVDKQAKLKLLGKKVN